jgi:hypothetical protein
VVLLNFTNGAISVPVALPDNPAGAWLCLSTDSTRALGFLDLTPVTLGPDEGVIVNVPAV